MRDCLCAYAVAFQLTACGDGTGSDHGDLRGAAARGSTEREDASAGCDGLGEALHPGLVRTSNGGFAFEILELIPETPILSQSRPGNSWRLRISDGAGAPATGAALSVRTLMPDHGHAGPPAVGIEQAPGVYAIEDLLLPMPALYSITVIAALPGTGQEAVDYSICISAETG